MNSDDVDFGDIVVNQPSLSADGPLSTKPWKYLTRFEVTCQGREKVVCPVYANGRQQVPIQINIEARDEDGVVVDVNHSKLYLNLVSYDDVDHIPPELGRSKTEDSRFIYNWQVGPAGAAEEGAGPLEDIEGLQSVKQFVTSTKVGTYKLAARCRSPEWVLFTTNTSNPAPGKFDSWLLIDARQPEAIEWSKVKMTKVNAVNVTKIDVDLYYIYFESPNLRVVDTVHSPHGPANRAHYQWKNGSVRYEQICYSAAGGSRLINWRSCTGRTCQFRVYDRAGQATAARITTDSAAACPNVRRYGVYLGLVDQFGNESRVGVHPIRNGNEITLVDPNSKDLGFEAEGADDVGPHPDSDNS